MSAYLLSLPCCTCNTVGTPAVPNRFNACLFRYEWLLSVRSGDVISCGKRREKLWSSIVSFVALSFFFGVAEVQLVISCRSSAATFAAWPVGEALRFNFNIWWDKSAVEMEFFLWDVSGVIFAGTLEVDWLLTCSPMDETKAENSYTNSFLQACTQLFGLTTLSLTRLITAPIFVTFWTRHRW